MCEYIPYVGRACTGVAVVKAAGACVVVSGASNAVQSVRSTGMSIATFVKPSRRDSQRCWSVEVALSEVAAAAVD